MNVGGRNLLYNSKQRITNSYYNIATYRLTEELKVGELLTITIKGQLGTGKIAFALYDQLGNVEQCALYDRGKGIYQNTFNYKGYRNGDKMILSIWTYYRTVSAESTIEWIKLEKGNKPTDWSPAPEDIENKVADIQTDLTTAINNAKAQIEAEKRNIENSNTRIQKLENKTQIFSDTQIDGNVVATGTLIVGNTQGTKAGITGMGMTNDSIRFWAGEPDKKLPVETPQQAEQRRRQSAFLVQEDGTMYAKNAHISGQVNATSGNIGYFYINDEENHKRGRIYAGSRKTSEITIGNIGIEIESDSPLSKLSASFGNFNSMVFSNTYAAEKIDYTGSSSNRIGSYIKMRPQLVVSNDTSLAQFIDGNILSIGKRAIYEDGYIGNAFLNVITDNIKYSHTYIFTGVVSEFTTVNLPDFNRINQITGKSNVTFELTIIMSIHVEGRSVRIQGVNGGALLDNNGNWHAGNNFGYMDMGKGDV